MSTNPTKVVLHNVRLAFPRLEKPEQVNGEGKPAFSAALILESDSPEFEKNRAAIEAAMLAAARSKWGEKAEAMIKQIRATDKLALHDGDLKAQMDGYAGNWFVNTRSDAVAPPTLVRRDRTPISREKDESGVSPAARELYAGCYVNAIITLWAQDNQYGKRINASLGGVQFFAQGVPFAGSAAADVGEFEQLDNSAWEESLA